MQPFQLRRLQEIRFRLRMNAGFVKRFVHVDVAEADDDFLVVSEH